MRTKTALLIAALCLVGATAKMSAPPETKPYSLTKVARGKYLVVDAGTCQDATHRAIRKANSSRSSG